MYCVVCGKTLDENGHCPSCGFVMQNPETPVQNPRPPYQPQQPYPGYVPLALNLKNNAGRCAWFAAVSFVVWWFLNQVIGSVPEWILYFMQNDRYYREYDYYLYYYINSTIYLVLTALALGGCILFFNIAAKGLEKGLRKKCFPVAFVPAVAWIAYDAVYYTIHLLARFILSKTPVDITLFLNNTILWSLRIFFGAAFALVSFFIARKLLKNVSEN